MVNPLEAKIDAIAARVENIEFLVKILIRHAGEPKDELVGAEFVARIFDCSVDSVREGKANTGGIRWVSRHPLKCLRSEAYAALKRLDDRARARAARKVPSLVRRKPR